MGWLRVTRRIEISPLSLAHESVNDAGAKLIRMLRKLGGDVTREGVVMLGRKRPRAISKRCAAR
jgi:hypothetical protein